MEVTIQRNDLDKILRRATPVADHKSTMPMLANILLRCEDGQVHFTATDLYRSVTGSVDAKVSKSGAIAIGAKDLEARVKAMPSGNLTIIGDDKAVQMKAEKGARKFRLPCHHAEDFPPVAKAAGANTTASREFHAVTLSRAIGRVISSVGVDESRAHLNAIKFEADGTNLRTVSTDGHRLTLSNLPVSEGTAFEFLLPLKGATDIRRMCDEASAADAGSVIRVTIADNNAFFDFAGMVYSIKLVDAKFPPYSQVIPKGNDSIAEVDRLALIEACKAISVASNERTGGVKFRFSKGTLRIEAESPEHGDGADELIIGYTGPNISVGFNAKYIVDACNVLSCEEVVLKLNGELDPLMVAPEAESGDDFLCVVMPMRI